MKIDLSNCTKFGSLSEGGGLSAVFDGNLNTVGYAESTSGYVGVTFFSPSRVDRVECVSADNGFDASGMTTKITLQLYAKVGGQPSYDTDGVLLAEVSFTDKNYVNAITLTSSDKYTEFDNIWIRMVTGVWCILSDFRVFEASNSYPETEPLGNGSHVFLKSCNENVPLSHAGAEIHQFRTLIVVSEPRTVLLDFHGDVVHIGNGKDAMVAVGFSFRICIRSAETIASLQQKTFVGIKNAVGGGNVSERNPQHYGNKSICSAVVISPGIHEISVIGSGHTDGSSTQGLLQVLAEGGLGLNCLRCTVLQEH